jgi:hypothetical protein
VFVTGSPYLDDVIILSLTWVDKKSLIWESYGSDKPVTLEESTVVLHSNFELFFPKDT